MSDLRETLIRRFGQVLDAYYGGPGFEPELRNDCADECIRQMRWAFHDWPEDAYPDSGSETAAPDDWEVPK